MDRILVCCSCSDLNAWLAALSVLRPLTTQNPGVEITWVGVEASEQLFVDHPAIASFEILPKGREGACRHRLESLAKKQKPDLILHLHNGAPVPLGACSGTPVRSPGRGSVNASSSFAELRSAFLSLLPGENPDHPLEPFPWVHLPEMALHELGRLFPLVTRTKPFFILDPGVELASSEWPAACWTEIAREFLSRQKGELVVVGESATEPAVVSLFSELRSAQIPFHLLAGHLKPVELGWLLRKADWVACTRTSTALLSASLGKYCVWIGGNSGLLHNSAQTEQTQILHCLSLPTARRKWHENHGDYRSRMHQTLSPQKVIAAIESRFNTGTNPSKKADSPAESQPLETLEPSVAAA